MFKFMREYWAFCLVALAVLLLFALSIFDIVVTLVAKWQIATGGV